MLPNGSEVALSPREREVVHLMSTGSSVRDAAAELGVVVKTIEMHLYHAQKKLGLRSRMQLIRHAQQTRAYDAGR